MVSPSAPHLAGIRLPDPAADWQALGFHVEQGLIHFGSVLVRVGASEPEAAWTVQRSKPADLQNAQPGSQSAAPAPLDIDGIAIATPAIEFTREAQCTTATPPTPHPNGISTIDHVVVMTPDLDRTLHSLDSHGLTVERIREAEIMGQPVRQAFVWLGEVIAEFVGPQIPKPHEVAPSKIWGLALVAEDFDATLATLRERCGRPRPAVQKGRRIATIKPPTSQFRTALAVMSPHYMKGQANT